MPEETTEAKELIEDVWPSSQGAVSKTNPAAKPTPVKRPAVPAAKPAEDPKQEKSGNISIVIATLHREIDGINNKISALKEKEIKKKSEVNAIHKEIYQKEQNIVDLGEKISQEENEIDEFEDQIKDLNEKIVQIKKLMTEFEDVA
ncbi:MAG: hypothetical protein ABIF92_00055 [archaeon]